MAGTDKTQTQALGLAPAVILVNPQLGENIGTAARAMANFGLHELHIVDPRDGWPNERALKAASGADWIIESAAIHATDRSLHQRGGISVIPRTVCGRGEQ